MSQYVEVPDKFDVEKYVYDYLNNPCNFQLFFDNYLKFYYGVDSHDLGELLKEQIPEKMI